MSRQTYCDCMGKNVDRLDCDHCDFGSYFEDDDYEEPPLYPAGQLETFTPEDLIKERDRQNRIHDLAVDRCEELNSPTIETAAGRAACVVRELVRRGLNPHADKPEAKR